MPEKMSNQESTTEVISQIERLAELKKKDYLTEEEYAKMKSELLAKLSDAGEAISSTEQYTASNDKDIDEKPIFSADDLI